MESKIRSFCDHLPTNLRYLKIKKLSYVDLRYSVGAAVGFSEADIN